MIVRVRVGDREFEVEVGDLHTRPILAKVGGERFEVWPEPQGVVRVWPETGAPQETTARTKVGKRPPQRIGMMNAGELAPPRAKVPLQVCAPIPGVIDSVAARVGGRVSVGDELCVIEAMKMKNVIRSPWEGELAAIHVSTGQRVRHNEVLVEFVP